MKPLLPPELVGHFFGVGSLSTINPSEPLDYIQALTLPYLYQLPNIREEDMIRQYGAMISGFEEEGNFILDMDIYTYRDIVRSDEPILPDKDHFRSHQLFLAKTRFNFLKTQQTAPATMCFSIRDRAGSQLISLNMFHLFVNLMKRVALGQVKHLSPITQELILCQDDPSLGLVFKSITDGKVRGLSPRKIIRDTDQIYPSEVIPAFHYCDDWREVKIGDWYPLWEEKPKLMHIDIVSYLPVIDEEQAEKVNGFLDAGGGFALGILPNLDDKYTMSVKEYLPKHLNEAFKAFQQSGVSLDLLVENVMISTQCGLPRASDELIRDIHESASDFPNILKDAYAKLS
jgi:hypothetical protein